MARDDENEEKTNAFVDFLLEDEEELDIVPQGEFDSSAMEAGKPASAAVSIELDTSFDLDEVTNSEIPNPLDWKTEEESTEVTTKTKSSELEAIEAAQESSSHDLETLLISEDQSSSWKEEQEEKSLAKVDDSEEDKHTFGKHVSSDYPTQITGFDQASSEDFHEISSAKNKEKKEEFESAVAEVLEENEEKKPEVKMGAKPQEVSLDFEEKSVQDPVEKSEHLASFFPSDQNKQSNQLQVSQNLKKAQDKIIELEELIEKLRMENQDLGSAGEILKRKVEELNSEVDRINVSRKDVERRLKDEIQHSQMRLQGKQQENQDLKVKVESLELRLKRDLQMVRVRERELENRLEIVKLENSALLRSKDEHILELKRNIDQNKMEAEQLKDKLKKLSKESDGRQEKIRRTVRTLRLALNMLDEEDAKSFEQELKKSG